MAETKSLRQGKLITEVSGKQATLVSGMNIKTVNGNSILGSGDITISGGVTDHTALSNIGINTHAQIDSALTRLANTSGTNTGDQDLSGYSLTTHNHNGVYEPADATILKDADIGSTVQGYSANTTIQGNTFNGANQLVKLDATGKLPAIDGSALTNLPSGASALDGLTDVTITTPSSGQVLKYNGSAWINDTDATGGGGGLPESYSELLPASYTKPTVIATAGTTAVAIGFNSSNLASAAMGDGSMTLNGSYASGTDSFAAAVTNNTSSYGATGANSIAIGRLSKATGAQSIAFNGGVASATGAVALGGYSGVGVPSATAQQSFALGVSVSNIIGKLTYGCRQFSTVGDKQLGKIVLGYATTDATPVVLGSNGSSGGTNNQLVLDNNTAYTFFGTVIAKQSGSTNVASWKIEGVIVRGTTAGSTTLVASTVTAISNVPAWTLELSADTTNGALAVTFTGASATSIRCAANIETIEVTYA